MALKPDTNFAGKINPATAAYPYGSARNVTTQDDGTGTPFIDLLINDNFGWQQALLDEAGIVPSGSPDSKTTSQYMQAFKKVLAFSGQLVFNSTADFSTGTLANGVVLSDDEVTYLLDNELTVKTNGFYSGSTTGNATYKFLNAADSAAAGYVDGSSRFQIRSLDVYACLDNLSKVTLEQFGAVGNGVVNDTIAVINAISLSDEVDTRTRDNTYLIEYATVLSETGTNKIEIASNKKITGNGVFLINSNQLADGTRFELAGSNIHLSGFKISEINSPLTRSNVYAPLAGFGATDFTIKDVEIDGANGAGMHFRVNCRRFSIVRPKIRNTKADGIHIQRGSQSFTIIDPDIQLTEDDCIGVVGHGRNEGYDRAGFGAIYCTKELGSQANGAVGSGIALIGCTDVDVYNLRTKNTGLSGVRIQAFVDVTEGNYTAQNIRVFNPRCISSGITTDMASGLLKDGISIGNASNVRIINPICTLSVNHGISISDSCVDLLIKNAKCFRSGKRGVWLSSTTQSASWAMELWQDDPRKGAATTVENHFLKLDGIEVDYSGDDGIYVDGTASGYVKEGEITGLTVKRSNVNNTTGKYGVFIKGIDNTIVDGFDGGTSGSGTALQASYAFVSPITNFTINGAASRIASLTVPYSTEAGRRKFWNSTQPTVATGIDGGYLVGDEVYNFNPASGVKLWTCTAAGDPATWVAINHP